MRLVGRTWERVSPDAFKACAACSVRLSGSGGTFVATSDGGGGITFPAVPTGSYRIERVCGGGAEPAAGEYDDISLPYANITVPKSGPVNFNLERCAGAGR